MRGEFSTNDSDGARAGARSLPTHAESRVFFSCGKILEVKQSSVKKERVFHTQECKMLHNSAEILILCIRISKFYNFNTLDNWGHKTPTQSKRKRTGKKRLKGHSPKHIQYTWLHPWITQLY